MDPMGNKHQYVTVCECTYIPNVVLHSIESTKCIHFCDILSEQKGIHTDSIVDQKVQL